MPATMRLSYSNGNGTRSSTCREGMYGYIYTLSNKYSISIARSDATLSERRVKMVRDKAEQFITELNSILNGHVAIEVTAERYPFSDGSTIEIVAHFDPKVDRHHTHLFWWVTLLQRILLFADNVRQMESFRDALVLSSWRTGAMWGGPTTYMTTNKAFEHLLENPGAWRGTIGSNGPATHWYGTILGHHSDWEWISENFGSHSIAEQYQKDYIKQKRAAKKAAKAEEAVQ